MLLTGDCNPGDSLGPVTMETSNQGKNVGRLFLQLIGPRKYLRSSTHMHTHSRMDDLLPVSLVFKRKVNISA